MRPALLLALYLGDQIVSGTLPFSSGPFSIATVLLCWSSSTITSKTRLRAILVAGILLTVGFFGANFSGTPATAFFVVTTIMMTLMWVTGAGLHPGSDILISTKMGFIGVFIATAFMIFSLLGWDAHAVILNTPSNRAAGLFMEPSHYALFVMPLWLIAHQEKRYRPALYAALVFTCLTCFSATLAAFALIAWCLNMYFNTAEPSQRSKGIGRRTLVIAFFAMLAYFATMPVNVEGTPLHTYIQNRINGLFSAGDPGASNLSSLVVLQGVELAHISMLESLGFGVGLGNFGLSEQIVSQSEFKKIINTFSADALDLNLRDGGLLLNKLVGELGLFSILLLFALVVYIRRIRHIPDARSRHYHGALATALICMLFVRVLPYFAGPTCLALFSMAGILHRSLPTPAKSALRKRLLPSGKVREFTDESDFPNQPKAQQQSHEH